MRSEPRKDREDLGEVVVQFEKAVSAEQSIQLIAQLFRPLSGRYGSSGAVAIRWSDCELVFAGVSNHAGRQPYIQDLVAYVENMFHPFISRVVLRERWAVVPIAEDWATRISFMKWDVREDDTSGPKLNYSVAYTERAIVLATYSASRSPELRKMAEDEIAAKLAEQLTQQGINPKQLFVEHFPIPAEGFGPSRGFPFVPVKGDASPELIETDSSRGR
jgi:hypothetical protein